MASGVSVGVGACLGALRKHELPPIEDDVDAELHYGAQWPRPATACGRQGLVMSHAFGHCLRLNYGRGWGAQTARALATLGRIAKAAARRRA